MSEDKKVGPVKQFQVRYRKSIEQQTGDQYTVCDLWMLGGDGKIWLYSDHAFELGVGNVECGSTTLIHDPDED